MEATANAAPASTGAGTESAQSGSTSSPSKASNSAGQNSPTQRQSAGAASPSSSEHEPKQQARQTQSTPQADDDPEFDFGEGRKAKRSRVVEDFNRMRQSQAAEAKRASEAHKRFDEHTAHLKKLGIDPEAFAKNPEETVRQYTHDYVRRQIEEAQMDPRELDLKRREETLQEREERIRGEDQTRQEQEHSARVDARADEFASEMHEALAASNLPRNPQTVARMATLMLAAARKGVQIPKAELAARVAHQVAAEQEFYDSQIDSTEKAAPRLQKLLSHYSGDAESLARALGPEIMDGLRKQILQEAQSKFAPQQSQPRQRSARLPDVPRSHKTYHTLDEYKAMEQAKRAKAEARR